MINYLRHLCYALFLFNCYVFSQNLVHNSSFESKKNCPERIGMFHNNVENWSIPNGGTTDLFNSCSHSNNTKIKNYNGYQKPKSGQSYAGIYVYSDENYREYVQGQLSKTLEKDKKYIMTFYLSLAEQSSYALKDIEVVFTEEKLKPCYHANYCEKEIKLKKATRKNFKRYSNEEERYLTDKDSWMPFTFEFIAQGYEQYFSIGNFFRNNKSKKQKLLSTSQYFFSYYYIDDVSIIPVEVENEVVKIQPKKEKKTITKIKTDSTYTFKNVHFNFDKSELLNQSNQELSELYEYLNENSTYKIEIYGHTDDIGADKRNKELSEQRAKAVANYLISKGLNANRVKTFGFGSLKPISSNSSESGRQLNRRVEFKIIKP